MEIDKFFILTIAAIILLSLLVYWQFKGFRETLPEVELPEFEVPTMEPTSPEEKSYEEFVSPDGKLKLKYSSDWTRMEGLEKLNQEIIKEKAEVLLFAQRFKLEKAAFTSFIIQELSLEEEKSLDTIIEDMKTEAKEKETEMEIVELEIKDKEANFEVEYKREEGSVFISKEKLFLGDNKAYLVSFLALDRDWPEFETEIEEILNTVQFTP